jgi:hypothetical protein
MRCRENREQVGFKYIGCKAEPPPREGFFGGGWEGRVGKISVY